MAQPGIKNISEKNQGQTRSKPPPPTISKERLKNQKFEVFQANSKHFPHFPSENRQKMENICQKSFQNQDHLDCRFL